MGNFNESEGAAPIQRIYNKCNLVSVFHQRPEETPRGPTYIPAGTSPNHHACTPRIHQLILSRGIITNGHPSDHLTMFADLNTKGVFGNVTTHPTALPGRVLNSKSPKKVDTYVAYLSVTMTNHQLFSRMERLSARCARQGHALPSNARLFQTIDTEHTRLRHAAEKRCGRLLYGHPLSPELRSAGENIRYLKRQREEAYLRRAMEPLEARARTNTLLVRLQTELKGAWKHMKNTQTKAAKLRSRSNTERATRQSQQGNKDVAEILTEINKAETRTNTFHKIKRYLFPKLNSGSQMDHVLVESTEPDGTKSTGEITAPTELFETLLEQNKADFSRADGTPFTVPPMSDELPTFHWSDNAQRILNGTYKPPAEVSEEMRLFIHNLQFPDGTPPTDINITITAKDLRGAIASIPERTLSSSSGMHAGHYQAALHDECLIEFECLKMNIALVYSIPPNCWLLALQILLEKTPGRPLIHRLRIIQLLKMDMNITFKLIWGRRLVWNIEDNNLMEDTLQFRARPIRRAISAVLLKVVTYDLIRQLKSRPPCSTMMLLAPTTVCWLSWPPSAGDALGSPNWQLVTSRHPSDDALLCVHRLQCLPGFLRQCRMPLL